jgi:hypothetical protein
MVVAPNPSRLGSAVRMMIPSPSLPIPIGSFLQVYDARGSLLRTLPVGTETTEIVWDGADWRGRQAPAGIYWVRLTPDAGAAGGAEFGVSGMHTSVVRIR